MSDMLSGINMAHSDMKFIFNLHQTMLNRRFILVYEGEFSQDITKVLLSMTERKIESSGEEMNVRKKIFNVMVECLQNMSKHAAKPGENEIGKTSIFTIGRDADWYYISSGNLIWNDEIQYLKNRIEKVNNSTQEDLKNWYREVITSVHIVNNKDNTGLGLIDIARRSKEKLNYKFTNISDKLSFYSFQTKIKTSSN